MEWGRLFKSSSAENKRKASNSDIHKVTVTSTPSSPSPPSKVGNEQHPSTSNVESKPFPISPQLPPRTKTQIVQLTKEVEVRSSPVANAAKAVIDRSLVEGAILTTMLATRNFSTPKYDANSRSLTAKKVEVLKENTDENSAVVLPTTSDTLVEEDGFETPKTPHGPVLNSVVTVMDNHPPPASPGALTAKKLEIIRITQALLDFISAADFDSYSKFCDPSLTAFEPESLGNLVTGMDFHKFYFDNNSLRGSKSVRSSMLNPQVHLMGDDAATIAYIRLVQHVDKTGVVSTQQFEESRVWHKREGRWQLVHYHRSGGRVSTRLPA